MHGVFDAIGMDSVTSVVSASSTNCVVAFTSKVVDQLAFPLISVEASQNDICLGHVHPLSSEADLTQTLYMMFALLAIGKSISHECREVNAIVLHALFLKMRNRRRLADSACLKAVFYRRAS